MENGNIQLKLDYFKEFIKKFPGRSWKVVRTEKKKPKEGFFSLFSRPLFRFCTQFLLLYDRASTD